MDIMSAFTLSVCLAAPLPTRVPLPPQYYGVAPGHKKQYWQEMKVNYLIHAGTKTWILNADGTMSPFRGF